MSEKRPSGWGVWLGISLAVICQLVLSFLEAFALPYAAVKLFTAGLVYLTPLIYLVPGIALAYMTHNVGFAKGFIIAGAFMFILNGACAGLLIGFPGQRAY